MLTDIHIASYQRDIPYLRFNLRSIKKFCTGFGQTTIAFPIDDLDAFVELSKEFPDIVLWTYTRDADPAKWQIHAQAIKCLADVACPYADMILHTDSDCMFTQPVTPEDYLVGGKPVMLMKKYSALPPDFPWQKPTEKCVGMPVEYEFMRRHPQVNLRGLYSDLRTRVGEIHRMQLEKYVLEQKPTFPWGFSEHNALGAVAFYDPFWHDQYHWIDVDTHPSPDQKLIQFWSHSAIDAIQKTPWGIECTPQEAAEKLLA